MRMRISLAAGGAAAAFVLAGLPAGAQVPQPTLDVAPTSGPIGTTITVSGGGCILGEDPGGVDVAFVDTSVFDSDAIFPLAVTSLTAGEDGTWTAQLVVPASVSPDEGIVIDVVPGEDYVVVAACSFGTSETGPEIVYESVPFDVTGETVPTTPPTDPGSLPEAPVTVPVSLQAQPATPVVGDPDYTG
jgi:hypothetical protein